MNKNLFSNTSYRNLDVDAFDPDKFIDCLDDIVETPGIGPDEANVKHLLQTNKLIEALKAALINPPLKTKNQTLKNKTTALVTKVLTSFKSADILAAVNTLNADEVDLLMKFIYKAMEILPEGQQSCALLLTWHSHVFASCGHGGIVRVLCNRNRL